MKIEIWSDVVCPFCYIGKRKLEKALAHFPQKKSVEIEWKSFQLNPDLKTNPDINTLEYLAESKGWSLAQAREISAQVSEMAKTEGLTFNFENAIVANTKNAHRLIHLAKSFQKGGEMKERLLRAYFTESRNVDDPETLISIGQEVGLDREKIKNLLESNQYEDAVNQDVYESRLVGVKGVPFFVIDRRFGISGAQPDVVFSETLEKAWIEFAKENKLIQVEGTASQSSCEIDGDC
jgi:predicted DsbA family dithiol-disulfide isomerase